MHYMLALWMTRFKKELIRKMLQMVFHDNLAAIFNWKGQRGQKEKLCGRKISNVMIETMAKTFPNINSIIFGNKAGPWPAQASFRLKKNNNVKKKDLSSSNNDSETSNGF